jgi:predicted phosphodiesterase
VTRKFNEEELLKALRKPVSKDALASLFGVTPEEVDTAINALDSRYNVVADAIEDTVLYHIEKTLEHPGTGPTTLPWSGGNIIKIGVVGDTHIGSKYTQLTHLHAMYDIFKRRGVKTVLHAGDIDEGVKMREGHEYECYVDGADNHLDELVRVYPHRKGITTYFITGNHDHSLIKRAGYDIGKGLSRVRKDLVYLAPNESDIVLGRTIIRLMHPTKSNFGSAISLAPQQIIDSFTPGDKPHILIVGHYHKALYFTHRNVHTLMVGCFQSQTPFLRNKGVQVSVGGWILTLNVDDEGNIRAFQAEYFPFYVHNKDDWRNFR